MSRYVCKNMADGNSFETCLIGVRIHIAQVSDGFEPDELLQVVRDVAGWFAKLLGDPSDEFR